MAFTVGPGIITKMTEMHDTPATDEEFHDGWSVAFGASGRQYVYVKETNRVFPFDPEE